MFRYLGCNQTETEGHCNKFKYLDEVKSHIENISLNGNSSNRSIPDLHVYRIKDISDAINTSVILDIDQKEDYQEILTNQQRKFDASEEFIDICKNVGEFDVF